MCNFRWNVVRSLKLTFFKKLFLDFLANCLKNKHKKDKPVFLYSMGEILCNSDIDLFITTQTEIHFHNLGYLFSSLSTPSYLCTPRATSFSSSRWTHRPAAVVYIYNSLSHNTHAQTRTYTFIIYCGNVLNAWLNTGTQIHSEEGTSRDTYTHTWRKNCPPYSLS